MREHRLTLPELALLAGTRAALGFGLGLLVAGWLNDDQRKAAGWALLGVGGAEHYSRRDRSSRQARSPPTKRNGVIGNDPGCKRTVIDL